MRYIGEMGQHFCQRREQHKGDMQNKKASNGFYSHLKKNKGNLVKLGQSCVSRSRETLEGKKDQGGFVYYFSESGKGNRSEVLEFGNRF